MHKNSSFIPGQRQRTDALMITIADALNKHFGYTDADTDNIVLLPWLCPLGVGKGHVGGQTVYKNGSIETRFN